MCEPTTIATLLASGSTATAAAGTAAAASNAMLAIKGVTAVAGAGAAMQQASLRNQQVATNAASAKDAYFIKSKQQNLRLLQEQNQATEQKMDADLKAMRAQSTASAAAAASGVQGVDVDRLINDFERSEGVLTGRIQARLEGMQAQNEMDKLAFQSEAQNRINSLQPVGWAETLFKVAEPLAGFGLDYYGEKARLASLED